MTEHTWSDLTSAQRDTLVTIARLERDDIPATNQRLTELVDDSRALKDLLGTAITTEQDTYTLTNSGHALLRQHQARLTSILGHPNSDATVAVPFCPQCHAPITLLSPRDNTSVRATPCGCHLEIDTERDPLYETLTDALALAHNRDARTHLRQALQLTIARGEQ
ncbi:hypothetical protein [Halobaculum magnesiiphilum]|uniref:Uncharacterized protein n=1 Tax=Halobaculum magnesiiphilum TaxID=1017351 RepID=A0A8T8WEK5_9EURY|nr:hypothetical protein [Halobaculum magnesiiphilum]QZP38261.1 hypothetical protein K6T50_03650 [Halobaculum magnesiiphilum]